KRDNFTIIKSFDINNYISIKIITSPINHSIGRSESYKFSERGSRILISVKDKPLLAIPKNLFPSLKTLNQEIKEPIDRYEYKMKKKSIKTIFRKLTSNLIIWSENDYNTQLIDHKIAFPLLKELRKVGETHFQIILQQEILKTYASGTFQVKEFLKREGYLELIGDFF
ncbi:MAG: hypothetical protein ACFFG0_08620, partial [Candidatus Thorarchaeota archaeon]